jgi:carboxyl-terminal processing protease
MTEKESNLYRRKISKTIWIAVFAVNLIFGYRAFSKATADNPKDDGYSDIYYLTSVMQLIREKYVDADEVTYKKLVHNAIKGMLHGLDPFTSYMEPDLYKQMADETNGTQFAGLGIHIAFKNKKLKIIAPMYNAPAYKAGIKANDTILFIDGKPTTSMSIDDCAKLLKGDPGSEVTLTIHRDSENLTKEIKIVRELITPSTVTWSYLQDDNIGYVRIALFAKKTAEDLDKALTALKNQHITALILDLRGNPGGLLDSAVEVCSRFIKRNKLVVFVEGRSKKERIDYNALDTDKMLDIAMAILINGNSASAAEIVSGCLQDYKRAVLIGEKSFGKGSVQSIIPMPDKSAIRLTIAKYYTPSKRVIHKHGIEPNVLVDVDIPTENKLYEQTFSYPGVVMPDYSGAIRDTQLERAIEILKGIRLFNNSED